MKYLVTGIIVICSSVLIAHAQTATSPKQPSSSAPKAPAMPTTPKVPSGVLPKSPCEAEMKAATKNLPKVEAGKDPKSLPKPNMNAPEAKALQDCLKKNAPKGGAAAPVSPPSGGATAKVVDPTKVKVQAPPPATPPVGLGKTDSTKTGAQGVVKQGTQNIPVQQCPTITKVLQIGTRDNEVIALKRFLASEGVLQGVQNTDYFGAVTEKALKEWQKKKGIAQSGTTDTATRAAIKNCVAQKNNPAQTSTKK